MVNIEIIYVIYLLLCATLGYFIAKHICLKSDNKELKERINSEKKPMYNVWLSSLSNNLPYFFDNPHISGTEGKKCPLDFEDIAKKMSFKLTDLKPTEKDVALAVQNQQFEAKEKMYVEKIRQLEKILVAEEIALSADGQVTNMKADKLKYEKYELNLEKSNLQKEVERLNSLLKRAKVVMTVTKEDDNVLDIVDKILAEENTTGCGYNTKITLKPSVSKERIEISLLLNEVDRILNKIDLNKATLSDLRKMIDNTKEYYKSK